MKINRKFIISAGAIIGAMLLAVLRPVPLAAAPPLDSISAADARPRLIAAAETYLGTRYRYGGVDRHGLDCSGLVYLSFRDALGAPVPRTAGALYRWAEKISDGSLERGDLVFFSSAGQIFHVGIYAGEGRFIHSASSGPQTGVVYSQLDEPFWRRSYAGAGRVLPPETKAPGDRVSGGRNPQQSPPSGRFFAGVALAPLWAAFLEDGSPVRGAAAQFRLAYSLPFPGAPLQAGLELRPEWDGALGILRLPLALTLDFDRVIRLFAGPALCLGDPLFKTAGGDRPYTGGSHWLGVLGIQAAPLTIDLPRGALSLYAELCWQSLRPVAGQKEDFNADMAAALRISTGLRYTWGIDFPFL